jgi:hypothetical protein
VRPARLTRAFNRSFTFAFRPARMCTLTVEITVGCARAARAKSLIVS